jgi:predicted ATPase
MIHIARKPAPPSLESGLVKNARAEAKKFFDPAADRRQKHHKFLALTTRVPGFKQELHEAFGGKCAFCESYLRITDVSCMDRFRPKSGAIGLDGVPSADHYWWLAYEWSNLYLVCLACNKIRGDRFPVEEERATPGTLGDELLNEKPLLLDPCSDFPEDHLVFNENGLVASDSHRGQITIDILGLNRTPLVMARANVAASMQSTWLEASAHGAKGFTEEFFQEVTDERLSFRGLRRQCLQFWSSEFINNRPRMRKTLEPLLSLRTGVTQRIKKPSATAERQVLRKTFHDFKQYQARQEKFSVEKDSQKGSYYLKSRLVERLEIRNFKVIKELALDFPVDVQEQGSWLLLLGENGTGKSTVLVALTLALMGDSQRREFLAKHDLTASDFVRYGCRNGHVKVHLTGTTEPIVLKFKRGSKHFTTTSKEPKVLLLGYGATRLLPRETGRQKVTKNETSDHLAAKSENLFNPFSPLNDAERWLCDLDPDEFDLIARGLKQLLLLDEKEELIKDPDKRDAILVKAYRSRIPLDEMSAGYQSVVALTADVMSVLRLRWNTMEAAEGIVVVDEIDAHLHPRWKMQIVSRLRQTFPRLQFVVTSHDPLCLRGLHAGEVVVMKRDHRGSPFAIQDDLPAPDTLRVDQILTSEFFGLNSTVEPEVDKKFDQYYKLLAIRNPTAKQKAEIDHLKSELNLSQQLGTTRRERVMLEAVDTFLAEHDSSSDKDRRAGLKRETRQRILELWKNVQPEEGGSLK